MTKKLFAPMRTRRADTIRAKLAQLSLSDKDITEAIAWVRQFAMRKQKISILQSLAKSPKID